MFLELNQVVHSLCASLLYNIKILIRIQLLPFIGQRSHFEILFFFFFLSTHTCRVVVGFESIFKYSDLLMM